MNCNKPIIAFYCRAEKCQKNCNLYDIILVGLFELESFHIFAVNIPSFGLEHSRHNQIQSVDIERTWKMIKSDSLLLH